jgi:hypothetical protein
VRGLTLPAELISLLETGSWLHPGSRALRDLMPWFADPLMFMTDLGDMRFQNKALDAIAENNAISDLFRMTRTSRSGRDLDLPWLDVDQAVLVAINEYAGDDVALAWTTVPTPPTRASSHQTSGQTLPDAPGGSSHPPSPIFSQHFIDQHRMSSNRAGPGLRPAHARRSSSRPFRASRMAHSSARPAVDLAQFVQYIDRLVDPATQSNSTPL